MFKIPYRLVMCFVATAIVVGCAPRTGQPLPPSVGLTGPPAPSTVNEALVIR